MATVEVEVDFNDFDFEELTEYVLSNLPTEDLLDTLEEDVLLERLVDRWDVDGVLEEFPRDELLKAAGAQDYDELKEMFDGNREE